MIDTATMRSSGSIAQPPIRKGRSTVVLFPGVSTASRLPATTRAKLERWLASRKTAGGHPQVGELVRLIGDLAIDLSPAQTTTLGRETALLLLGAYQERHLPPPRWVRELAEHYRVPKSR